MFKVTDLCIKPGGGARTHEVSVDGRLIPYSFAFGIPTEMAESHARKLVPIIEGFDVRNEQDIRVLPTIPVTKGYGGKDQLLADDECVARLSELTMPALLERAWVLPGGEKITKNVGKDDIVNFIRDSRKSVERAKFGKPDLGSDDMTEEEIAALAKEAA